MKTYSNKWRESTRNKEFILGGHIFLPNPSMAEAMAYFGYKYLWVDAEHCAFDREEILNHIVAINSANAGAFVRVTSNEPATVKPILEMGPDGIIFPMVCSATEAEKAIAGCMYPPRGIRGFGPKRANHYDFIDNEEYFSTVEDSFVRIIQIEHKDAVANIDEILEVNGIDSVVIGPNDLSGSMGLIGQKNHPDVLKMCELVVEKCKEHKIPCGPSIGPFDKDYIKYWIDRKIDFLFCGDDISLVRKGMEATFKIINELSNGQIS